MGGVVLAFALEAVETMTDFSTLERLARAANKQLQDPQGPIGFVPVKTIEAFESFHKAVSPDVILALVAILKSVEAQGHGAKKEHCCVSAEYGECEICAAYDALTLSEPRDG